MHYEVNKYLEDLENRINISQEDKIYSEHVQFCEGRWEEEYFSPKRKKRNIPSLEWPKININDALINTDLMIIREFKNCSDILKKASGELMWVRCNYGVTILASLFGVEPFIMPYEMDTLPNCRPFENIDKKIDEIIEADIPDLLNGWGEKVFETGKRFLDIKNRYPKIGKYVVIDNPDCQSPMDICELMLGSNIFMKLCDSPNKMHKILEKITDTYIAFMDKWFSVFPKKDNLNSAWGLLHKGKVMLRDDSAMNLSPDMYNEFIKPYNERILKYYNGGGIHACGRVEHFVSNMSTIEKLYAFNMSQPELNDMEIVFKNTIDKDINIIGLSEKAVNDAVIKDRKLKGKVSTFE